MPPYTCQTCRIPYTHYDALRQKIKARHSEEEDDEDYEHETEESCVKRLKDMISLYVSVVMGKYLELKRVWYF